MAHSTSSAWFSDSLRSYASYSKRVGRRLVPLLVVLFSVILLRSIRDYTSIRLGNEAFVSGYSLAAIVAFLMLLGARKRLVTEKFGRMAIWQRSHHYLGLACMGAYVIHAGAVTNGWLETLLALSFWGISLSGLLSWYVNRTSPRMLRAAGPQILRQDIPERRQAVGLQAYELALSAAGKSDTAALANHYRDHLQAYFATKRSIAFRLYPSGSKRRRLLVELEKVDRYLDEAGRAHRQKMSSLVRDKDDLDFQSAIQNRVRLAASVHTWLLGGFVVFTLAHILAAHQFSSNW
jgi:hypothetical protein